jgi:hypothetical protein
MAKTPKNVFDDTEGDLPGEVAPPPTPRQINTDLPDVRELRASAGRHEQSRESMRRETIVEDGARSRADYIKAFAMEMYNNILPETPKIPGYHTCWVSTTNASDTPQRREAHGYERVRPEDLPGYDHICLTQGVFAGCIGLNEMILMKLPVDLWHAYMKISHEDRPYEQENTVRDVVRYLQETARDGGGDVYLGAGTDALMRGQRRSPTFSE